MISRNATIVVGPVVLAAVLIAILVGREHQQPKPFASVPIAIPFGPPSSGFLESKVADLVRSATLVSGATPAFPIDPGSANPPRREGSSGALPKPPDLLFLESQASRIAYVHYGKIGETPLATFFDSLKKEHLTKAEGEVVYGVRIASVTHSHVLLSYGNAPPLRKPRIDLEIDPRPDNDLSPEEREALRVRFEELWGNRARTQADERTGALGIPPYVSPEASTEGDPRQRYLDSLGPFLERIRAGDPDIDPRNDPFVPTVEELLRMRERSTASMQGATSDRPLEGKPPL